MIPDEAEEVLLKVAGGHHIHGIACLCGFKSLVSRDRTKHIMDTALEAAAPFIAAQALANAISYAEDQAMAGAYFPDWQNCAEKIRAIPNPYRSGT